MQTRVVDGLTMKCMPGVKFLLSLVLVCAGAGLCLGQTPRQAAPTIDYQRDIRPILSDNCFKCHGPDAAARQADLRLDRAADASQVLHAEQGEVPEILARIKSDDPQERMPPVDSNRTLSAEQIAVLSRWVEQGAEYSVHWSFRPISKPVPPETQGSDWPQSPIDQFCWDQMRAHGLRPSPAADKATLLRRLAFDLTGLPPTLEEIDQFLDDESPDAWERMVDHFLAQPSYGERMAFNWMEIARYADSYGYQVDKDRVVWQWRDWVIGAFNSNLPYDQFLIQQLAGDLLPNATDPQILATAFNRLHPQKSEGGSISEEFRNEYVADRVQTFATGLMGMTLECARCHDHKFDPVTQREYYQLYAFFNNIDEFGLHSYFTDAVPTPTLLLADGAARQQIAELSAAVSRAESELAQSREDRRAAFVEWAKTRSSQVSTAGGAIVPSRIAFLDFESAPAGPNRAVAGKVGSAAELTGDDSIDLEVGNFHRYEPFSVALWLKTPDTKDRAVVYHRSRAWTDAGSRGYELLIEDGRLSAALVHFWPGNAIRVQVIEPLPLNVWTHVVVTYDGSSSAAGLNVFVNGLRAGCETIRDSLSKEITGGGGDNIAIGARFRDRGFSGGCVDEFQVFNRQLTALEARQLFDGSTFEQVLNAGLENLNPETAQALFDMYLATADDEFQARQAALAESRRKLVEYIESIPEIMVMREMREPRPTFVLRRGAYDAPTERVEPGTPEALPPLGADRPRNRLGLALWLTDPRHPLTARVAVNRIWELIFGQGLVRTPEDFGSQGSPPTHPELLDWLANDLVEHHWDLKRLVKQMVLSATYRQSSWPQEPSAGSDPDNLWLSRANRRRLDAEMLRDQVLCASDLLDRTIGGPSVRPYEMSQAFNPQTPDEGNGTYRRSLYTYWKRMSPPPVMVTLDAVRREICTVKHERTATPLQAIVLLNDPQRIEAARILAAREWRESGSDSSRAIAATFRRLTGRQPRSDELLELAELFERQRQHYRTRLEPARQLLAVGRAPIPENVDPVDAAAMTLVASTIMNMDACITRR